MDVTTIWRLLGNQAQKQPVKQAGVIIHQELPHVPTCSQCAGNNSNRGCIDAGAAFTSRAGQVVADGAAVRHIDGTGVAGSCETTAVGLV